MTGSTRKHTLQIPAGLSLRRYNPEAAADFDSTSLYLNPPRLSPAALLAGNREASSTLQKIPLQRARGRAGANKPIHSIRCECFLYLSTGRCEALRDSTCTLQRSSSQSCSGAAVEGRQDTGVHVITLVLSLDRTVIKKSSLFWAFCFIQQYV